MFNNKKAEEVYGSEETLLPDTKEALIPAHTVIFWSGFFLILALIGIMVYSIMRILSPGGASGPISTSTSLTATSGQGFFLPVDPIGQNGNGLNNGASSSEVRAEYITFGQYYEPVNSEFIPKAEAYELPMNIKVAVSNYYDVSRKLSLDKYIPDLNQNGFVIFENQFPEVGNDFFELHRTLMAKEIPVVITTDFIFYYYQNILKKVYKEIELNAFYDSLWQITDDLYGVSLARYKRRLVDVGLSNDPVLEAMRLELAYFAVTLKLLQPKPEQIHSQPNLLDETKFNIEEADNLIFEMPAYLSDDVNSEVDLIRFANRTDKSPVLRYVRNYEEFTVPIEYKTKAKLNNFYLATRWLNSSFPLYDNNDDCSECQLDYNDWLINFAASCYLTRDLFDNQDIKNEWAIIYKFISYFNGLRSNLTYLHNHESLVELFGDDYSIDDIFSNDNIQREEQVKSIQSKLDSFEFSALEGGYSRTDPEDKPKRGMRLLQDEYWPNSYIFDRLTGKELTTQYDAKTKDTRITSCKSKETGYFRCRAVGKDIIGLVASIGLDTADYREDIKYNGFTEAMSSLRQEIGEFDVYTWNNNIYWSTLDITKTLYDYDAGNYPAYMRSDIWQKQKIVNTMLGSWVNLHLPEDSLVNFFEIEGSGLASAFRLSELNYVEPNIKFFEELIAKNNMMIKMLDVLKVSAKTNAVAIELKELNKNLYELLNISKKEINNEVLSNEEHKYIHDFLRHFVLAGKQTKSISLNFKDNNHIEENISGLKLLGLVYQRGEKLLLAIGPLFNYYEY